MAIGAALSNAARGAVSVVMPAVKPPRSIDENGMPRYERTPKINRGGHSVAHGKRLARKARNKSRNRRAHK
jgi:hypothetical protein